MNIVCSEFEINNLAALLYKNSISDVFFDEDIETMRQRTVYCRYRDDVSTKNRVVQRVLDRPINRSLRILELEMMHLLVIAFQQSFMLGHQKRDPLLVPSSVSFSIRFFRCLINPSVSGDEKRQ